MQTELFVQGIVFLLSLTPLWGFVILIPACTWFCTSLHSMPCWCEYNTAYYMPLFTVFSV